MPIDASSSANAAKPRNSTIAALRQSNVHCRHVTGVDGVPARNRGQVTRLQRITFECHYARVVVAAEWKKRSQSDGSQAGHGPKLGQNRTQESARSRIVLVAR